MLSSNKRSKISILLAVSESGSISAAARKLGVSYKSAWQAVNDLNNMSKYPLIDTQHGGTKGGGTTLTEHGNTVLKYMLQMEDEFELFLDALGKSKKNFKEMVKFMSSYELKTSMRNQFAGEVTKITTGAVNSEIILNIGGDDEICAIITNESVTNLGLEVGSEAYALVKASFVIIAEKDVKTSARNHLVGKVILCSLGAVNGEVQVELAGKKIVTAIITNESIKNLNLKVGMEVAALIKASSVIIAS